MFKLKEKWCNLICDLQTKTERAMEERNVNMHIKTSSMTTTAEQFLKDLILLPYLPFLIERFTDIPYNSHLPIFVNGESVKYTSVLLPDGEYTIGYIADNWRVIVEDEEVKSWHRLEAKS